MYNLGIHILSFILKVLAFFNPKIKRGVEGRRQTFDILQKNITPNESTIWFHCASLGEYEQGLPVFEVLRQHYSDHKIILSFFSPSGYEVRKNTTVADVVVYLPLDTIANAKRFLELVHPEFTVFVKYDIWPNLLLELKRRNRRAILISALFRNNQSYFKAYGGKLKSALFAFEHIFVQDDNSKILLNSIGFDSVSISGDTRFDRVTNQLKQNNVLDFISVFKGDSTCVVIGSSWAEDEAILIPYINANASETLKFIIAPHEIQSSHIKDIRSKLKVNSVLFSKKEDKNLNDFSVLIVDTIGLLTKIYSYADIAYVGGAMGKTGLHNILEPAVFGIPIIIGDNYDKFPEAKALIDLGGVTSVASSQALSSILDTLISNDMLRKNQGQITNAYIDTNSGAVLKIMSYLRI